MLDSANATIAAADAGGQPAFTITSVSYSVAAGREGNWSVVPILVNPSNDIVWAGDALVATVAGPNTFAINSGPIAHGGLDHRIGFYQWQNGAGNNTNGGTITFGNAGGEGMFQMDVDSTVVGAGDVVGLNVVGGHSSPTRDYNYENEIAFVPEPSAIGLLGLTGLAIMLRRRRR